MNASLASIMPQVIGVWCQEEGHKVTYVCYTGFEDLLTELPDDVDVVFIGAFTEAAHTAYALSNLFRRRGAITVIGGPHARCYPEDAANYFDYVLGFTDKATLCDVLRDCSQHRPAGVLPFPPAANRDTLTVAQLADLYVAAYKEGRDSSRLHYLREWVARLATARVREHGGPTQLAVATAGEKDDGSDCPSSTSRRCSSSPFSPGIVMSSTRHRRHAKKPATRQGRRGTRIPASASAGRNRVGPWSRCESLSSGEALSSLNDDWFS